MGKLVDAFEDWVDNGHMTRGESLGDFYRRFCRQYEAEHPTCEATKEDLENAAEQVVLAVHQWGVIGLMDVLFRALGLEPPQPGPLERQDAGADARRETMPHWTSMTIDEMVDMFHNLFSVAELREQLATSEKAIANHLRRMAAILLLLKEETDGTAK